MLEIKSRMMDFSHFFDYKDIFNFFLILRWYITLSLNVWYVFILLNQLKKYKVKFWSDLFNFLTHLYFTLIG